MKVLLQSVVVVVVVVAMVVVAAVSSAGDTSAAASDSEEALTFDDLVEEEVHKHHDHQTQEKQEEVFAMGVPDVFTTKSMFGKEGGGGMPCHENGVVASWCDNVHLNVNDKSQQKNAKLDCVILPEFDMYGCSCVGDSSLCPTECIDGGDQEPVERTKYGISCRGIPDDEPNYILKEMKSKRDVNHCENNAVVAAWCDDYVNKHLECKLQASDDTYSCRCSNKVNACPLECVDPNSKPIEKSHGFIKCKNIPIDQPNYILKEKYEM